MKQLNIGNVEVLAKSRGFKMTPQRRAIIGILQGAKNHPTIDDVIEAVNKEFPMASRATVYNTVNWLKEVGMLREIVEAGKIRMDPNFDPHHHFVCQKCGMVEDIGFDLIDDLRICTLPNNQTIESFEIVLRGICGECQK